MFGLKIGFVGLGDQGAPMPTVDAMRARGLDPSSVRDRGLGGADGVVTLAQWIEGRTTPSE
jgi:3-hydroxyisobutyrate dehydrogenase-like beta-hydroxyacid dehydrogenase